MDKLTFKDNPKAWTLRQERWKHNSFLGHVRMAQMNMQSILNSRTATDEAKAIAVRIEADAALLREALKDRKAGT